jgi:hypothetical protein
LMSMGEPTWFETVGAKVWKLLIIESFSQWKLNKIQTKNCTGIWGHSWCCWKAFGESDLIEFISQFSELRCVCVWKILICEWILFLEIQINCKNWVGKEKSVEPSKCSHCRILKFSILKLWKIMNMFTLGPPAQAITTTYEE